MLLQVRANLLTRQRAQAKTKFTQQAVQPIAIRFTDTDNELRRPRFPHQARYLSGQLVFLGELEKTVLDAEIACCGLGERNEIADRIRGGDQHKTMLRQRRYADIYV